MARDVVRVEATGETTRRGSALGSSGDGVELLLGGWRCVGYEDDEEDDPREMKGALESWGREAGDVSFSGRKTIYCKSIRRRRL